LRFDGIHRKVGLDFPGETFHVLRERKGKKVGEYGAVVNRVKVKSLILDIAYVLMYA